MLGALLYGLPVLISTRLEAFDMKGLRKILWVSWTAKKTN